MKTVLITGAFGFLGQRLLKRLAADAEYRPVAVTSRRNTASFPKGIVVECADLLDPASVQQLMECVRPDVCVHLAWDQRDAGYRNSPSNYQWAAASLSLFAAFQACGGRQFLFAGTSGEYEGQSETAPPMSLYGRCTRAVSELLLDTGKQAGIQVQIPRYFTIYGPGETHAFGAIPSAICSLLNGRTFACKSPSAIRDYIYIEDAADATICLLNSDYEGAVDIGSGIPRSMREVFDEIARQLGRPELISYGSETGLKTTLVADPRTMREHLHPTPQTDFSSGIANSIAYWQTQLGADTHD